MCQLYLPASDKLVEPLCDYGRWSPKIKVTTSGVDVTPSIFVDISSKLEYRRRIAVKVQAETFARLLSTVKEREMLRSRSTPKVKSKSLRFLQLEASPKFCLTIQKIIVHMEFRGVC